MRFAAPKGDDIIIHNNEYIWIFVLGQKLSI